MPFQMGFRLGLYFLLTLFAGCSGKQVPYSARAEERAQRAIAASWKLPPAGRRSEYEASCREKSPSACFVLRKTFDAAVLTRLPILQGVTNDTTTQLSLMHDVADAPDIALVDRATLKLVPIRDIQRRTYLGSNTGVTWVRYRELQPGKSYALVVAHADGSLWDLRNLSTLNTRAASLKFAVASCMDDYYIDEQKGMWNDLLAQKPNVLFLIGDNVYGDKVGVRFVPANGLQLWNRFVETWSILNLFKAETLVPTFQTWDDHDYGINDGDRDYPYKDQALEVTTKLFAREMVKDFYVHGPGIASTFRISGQQFVLMDARTFRSPAKDKSDETHWGKEQETWLYNVLDLRSKTPVWLINGDQFFGAYHPFESYEGRHPQSFKALLARLKKVKSPVVFLSGDRHNTELMKVTDLGYTTYEFTTSPIHAKLFPMRWKAVPNPRQVAGVAETFNYGVIEAKAKGSSLNVTFSAFGPNKTKLYSHTATIAK